MIWAWHGSPRNSYQNCSISTKNSIEFLAKNNTLVMPQPPYSPDLAPCDFFLFPKLKRPMKGRRYATIEEIKTASKEELNKITKNYFLKCFEDCKKRWHKCIISGGDYFEGNKIDIHEEINNFWKKHKIRYTFWTHLVHIIYKCNFSWISQSVSSVWHLSYFKCGTWYFELRI